jgi:hypothetical protein
MFQSHGFRIRALVTAIALAALGAALSIGSVLADGGGGPFPH